MKEANKVVTVADVAKTIKVVQSAEKLSAMVFKKAENEMKELLVGKCFICQYVDGELLVIDAEKNSRRSFIGRRFSIADYEIIEFYETTWLAPAKIKSLTIISRDEFERLYKAAQNIRKDYLTQKNELAKIINDTINNQ